MWLRHYKIHDHLGNIRSVIKDFGTGNYEIASQYDYKPFGGVLSNIGEDERQTFLGKEKDAESSLGDFGVRKYDDLVGRFFQIDPLWEKYYGWTPYQYSANNPVSFLDPEGRFTIANHTKAYQEAGIFDNGLSGWAMGTLDGLISDGINYFNESLHFDNLDTYDKVMANVDALGGFKNMPKHSLGDFFAHSNYVDIWVGLGNEGAPPLPTEVEEGSEFDAALRDNLRTTNYHGLFGDENGDPYGHNDGYEQQDVDNTAFGAKDKEDDSELFEMAFQLYIRALKAYRRDYEGEK